MGISPFLANQRDPTSDGDSFLGSFVASFVHGLAALDAAMLRIKKGKPNVHVISHIPFIS